MQSSERNTRSTRKFVPDPAASPGPESQSDTGQYLCIECSETFDTRLELSLHRQSHVTKKQFTCGHCGRGFHHQVFLQMHERSHEDPAVKSPPSRVISTRSSKMADVVHVRPAYTKPPPPPPRRLNSIVEFKNDPKACQAFAPRECVTRRGHGAPSPHQRDGPENNNLFELRISKFSDTTVHLLDSFGNSIEILADVFSTYTIGEAEGRSLGEDSTRTEEEEEEAAPSRNDSGQMSPQRLPEVPSANDPPPSHEPVTSLGHTDDDAAAGLPVPALPDLEGAEPPEEEQMEDQTKTASEEEPSRVPQENVSHDPPILPLYGEDHMDTSPEAGPQEVQDQPGAPLGQPAEPTLMVSTAEQPMGSQDSQDENSAIAALPVQPPGTSKAPPSMDDPGYVTGPDPSAPETHEEHQLPDDSTLLGLDAEAGHVDSPEQRPGDLSSAVPGDVSAYSPPLESRVQSGKEEAELCDTSSIDDVFLPPEDESMDGRSTKEHEGPASREGSRRIGVQAVIPEKRDLPSVSVQEKKPETEVCMTPQEVGDVSISEGEEIDLQVDSKDPEEPCSLLAEEEVLPGDELAIDDKRDEDLFERDIFPLEAGEKGPASIGEKQNVVCGGEARRTKRVQEKDSDICLNGSDMTYISESEMIKLLDQDKDDITDDEPTTTSQEDLESASQEVGFGAFPEPKLESELSNHNETKSSRSPGIWNGEPNAVEGTGELPAGLEGDSAEAEHYPSKLKTPDHVTSEVHNPIDVSTFQPAPEEKMDTDSCLPGSFLTIEEPGTGEPQNSMLAQEKSPKEQLGFPETSSRSNFQSITRNSEAAQPEPGLSCGEQSYEPHGTSSGNQDVTPVGDSTLSRAEDTQENVTPEEEDSDVCVTVEDNDGEDNAVQKVHPLEGSSLEPVHEKPRPGIPDCKGLLPATVCSTEPARADDELSSTQKEVQEPKPLPELHTETRDTVCDQERTSMEKNTLAGQEMENLPLDILDCMQSTSDGGDDDEGDDDDDHTKTASSEGTDVKNEGIQHKPVSQDAAVLKNQDKHVDDEETREQATNPSSGSDLFSKTLSTTENDESKENDPKGPPNNKLGELPTAHADLEGLEDDSILEDLENQSVPSPKTIHEDLVSEVTGDEDGSATKQASDVLSSVRRPVFQDSAPESLEDSELMEDDHQEDETPTKAMGAGGACLKCGRKLRRSRKELVWLPVCFKCRKAAKKLERLSAHEMADGLDLEPLVSRREEGLSADVSGSRVKEDGEGLQEYISSKPSEREASGSAAPKMYKCPKCDKAFRIPALLAGHMKCHALPQCLSCGCQMQLKYKTKRIPRRCQKCFQQLKEKMRAEKKVGEGSGDEDSGSSDEDAADSLVDVNLDDDDDISDEDSHVAVPRAKRTPVKAAKPGSRDPTEQIHDDVSLLGESPEGHAGETLHGDVDSPRKGKKQEIESSDELDASDLGLPDGEKPRLCPQCGKAFPCNRSLNLHLLSHSGIQCESCGCRLPKRRRVGRWSRKCRGCRLQVKGKLLNDSGDETAPAGKKSAKQKNVASVRLKAKPSKMTKNAKIQSMIKKKKELKWLNMLLAVKGLMDKSRKKKENALKAADATKKDGESSEAEKGDSSSVDNASILPDHPDMEKAGSSKLPCPPNKAPGATPKQGRKCLYREKNIVKVEENEALPYMSASAASISTAFIKKEESWQCLECNQSWPNSEALVNHQHSHISGQSLACPQCPQVFSSEQYLNLHVPAHDEERPFRCPECDKTFSKRNHLGVHMRVHSGSRPYACPDCPCRFRQKVTLIAHRYSHRNYQLLFAKPFQCSVCSKSFKQKERLVVHERLHTGECPFSCKDCDEVFPSKARLYVHRKTHKICEASSSGEQTSSGKEVSGGQPFKCQDCGKVCSTKASFVLHRKVHRLSSIPVKSIKREQNEDVHPFTCTDCNKVFSSKATLTVHLKNHSAHKAKAEVSLDPKEGFPCKHCDKVCLTKARLALHRKVHKSPASGEQNLDIKVESDTPSYTCKDCNKVCSTKASFALHRKVHKTPTDTETPPFRCQDCDMVCTTKASFVLHRRVHRSSPSNQQGPAGDAEPQLYNCKHCDMVCSTKASFVLHSKVHKSPSIGEENLKGAEEPQTYNCKHCDMVCSTKASFILHSKVHRPSAGQGLKAEEEPQLYTCKHCDVVCSTKASFALHSKVHRALFGSEQSPKTSEGSLSYSCKHCDMVCSTKASFVLHSKVHRSIIGEQSPKTPEEPQSYKCKECDLVCATKASFVLHLKVHRSDAEENPFACNDCGKVCSTKASFVLHRRVHKPSSSELSLGAKGGGAEPPFHCKDCGKFFTSKGRLAAHRRLHDGSSGHDRNSDRESDAEQPKKTSEEKPFPCTTCGRRFIKLKMLVRHKAVHGERTVTPCIHCGKQFLYMKSLFNHIKICQSKNKAKKQRLLKKAAAKRKLLKDAGGSTGSDGESAQKKRKIEEKLKAQKLKNKILKVKAKKAAPGKERGKGKAAGEPKTKDKRTKVDGEVASEGEGKKTAAEKQSDGRPEKPSEQAAKEPTPKKTLPKMKKAKKEPAKSKQKVGGGQKKWRVLAASTVKKRSLQAVLIGGKKKLLMKKKVQMKAKSRGKASKD